MTPAESGSGLGIREPPPRSSLGSVVPRSGRAAHRGTSPPDVGDRIQARPRRRRCRPRTRWPCHCGPRSRTPRTYLRALRSEPREPFHVLCTVLVARMTIITHLELRNNSADVLRRVAAGEAMEVTNTGTVVAHISPAPTPAMPLPVSHPAHLCGAGHRGGALGGQVVGPAVLEELGQIGGALLTELPGEGAQGMEAGVPARGLRRGGHASSRPSRLRRR